MLRDECLLLGTLVKTSGVSGDLIVSAVRTLPKDFSSWELMFIETDGYLVPFFISEDSIRVRANTTLVVQFDELSSTEASAFYIGAKVYVPGPYLNDIEADAPSWNDWIGFTVIDQNTGTIGILEDIIQEKTNPLLVVMNGKIEYLIPIVKQIVIKIDNPSKQIIVNCPEGLLSINSE